MKLARTMCIATLAVLMLTVTAGLVNAQTGWSVHTVWTDEDYITYVPGTQDKVINHHSDGYMIWYCPVETTSVYYVRDWTTTPDTVKVVDFYGPAGTIIWQGNYIP